MNNRSHKASQNHPVNDACVGIREERAASRGAAEPVVPCEAESPTEDDTEDGGRIHGKALFDSRSGKDPLGPGIGPEIMSILVAQGLQGADSHSTASAA